MHARATNDMPKMKDISSIAAENNPNREAFADGERRVTWSEFDAESRRAANAFGEHLAQGDRVAFICEASVDHAAALNGVAKAGAIPSNLHVRASPDTFEYCIDLIRPRVVVLDEEFSAFFEERVRDKITTDISTVVTLGEPRAEYEIAYEEFVEGQPETEPDVRVAEDDVAAIWWTSGTTGRPKGWCHTNRGIILKALKNSTTADRSMRRLVVFDPGFAAWWASTIPTMFANGTTVYRKSWDAEEAVRLIEEEELTHFTLVTTMWREILRLDNLDDYDLSSLESITSSGEKLDPTTLKRLEENICDTVRNGYAATEILGTAIWNDEMDGDRIESVGKPTIGQQIRVIEEGGSIDDTLPPGEIGEIVIKGADCPVWAWGNTEKTEEAFEDGWWHSGDLGYKDEDGYIFLEGRSDFMILSKGIKVFPSPVEERLTNHPGVEEAAVIGVEDEEYGEKVTAIVKLSDPDVTVEELDQWCLDSDQLARFERPRDYHFVDEIPKTATGKLDRRNALKMVVEE